MNEVMTKDFNEFCAFVRSLLGSVQYELEIEPGRKFIKLVKKKGEHVSVWGFVDKETGDILKAASWRAPAKHARGNINNPASYQDYAWTGPHYLRG